MFLATIGIVARLGGLPPAGTLLSSFCESISGEDANSNTWSGAWNAIGVYADGSGGSYQSPIGSNTNGCWHPYGWVYSSEQYDSSLSWSHGESSGDFVYGYSYSTTIADGSGGTTGSSGSSVTASDGTLIHSYTIYDEGLGYSLEYRLLFEYLPPASPTTREVNWPVAGSVLSSSCVEVSIPDAGGTNWSVMSLRRTLADGGGGSYTSDEYNTTDCGYYPSGFLTSRSEYALYIYYGESQSWQYGVQYTDTVADGMGSSTTLEPTNNIWYEAGYIFYDYYDEAGQQTIYYHFDGVSSYYTSTSSP